MGSYSDEEMLPLSGIQHYRFCPRQWALIHIEQEWEDNRLTFEGHLLHENVDNPFHRNKHKGVLAMRSVNVASATLGLYGIMDLIELHPATEIINAITHPTYAGYWYPYPVEYKHGKPKANNVDAVQLAAQAICLEEMYGVSIKEGAIYYEQVRHRELIEFSQELREEVRICSSEMHRIYKSQILPPPLETQSCKNCSIKERCNPQFSRLMNPRLYLKKYLYEETS